MAVTRVEYRGGPPQEPGLSAAARTPRAAASATRLLAAPAWAFRAGNAERLARYRRLAQPLAASLDRAVDAFAQALGRAADQGAGESGDRLASRLAGLVDAYNDLSSLLFRNADLLDADFPARFRDPVADLAQGLAHLGLARTPGATLSFSRTALARGLALDPERTRSLLQDPDRGLLTRWAKAAEASRDGGAARALLPPTLFADLGPPAAEELRLERSGRLLDVLESVTGSASRLPDLLDAAQTLSGLAAAKRSGLANPLLPEGVARLLERQG